MRTLTEMAGALAARPDMQWLNDKRPVRTLDGRAVTVTGIDRSKIPNIVLGRVVYDAEANPDGEEFSWDEDGQCVTARDSRGNPYRPGDGDRLVKA